MINQCYIKSLSILVTAPTGKDGNLYSENEIFGKPLN